MDNSFLRAGFHIPVRDKRFFVTETWQIENKGIETTVYPGIIPDYS
jgi:hypothetical protein